MEGRSLKEKILYWGGITLISSVIIGGSYYIYQSIFGSDEEEKEKKIKEEKEENINDSIMSGSFQLNDSNQNIPKNNNIEISSSNNINNINNNINIINNINSTIFTKNENLNIGETENNNINTNINNNINNDLIKDEEVLNEEKEEKIENNINIFDNDIIFLKSFGINIEDLNSLINNNNKFTDEGIVRIIIYINFLADKFYIIDNPDLDAKRRAILIKKNNNNDLQIEQEYLSLCNETFMARHNVYQIAAEKILKSLRINFSIEELQESVKAIEPKKLEDLSIKLMMELNQTLLKYDLNIMDINQTKEAYVYYLKIFTENAKKIIEPNENININNEENNMAILKYMALKMQMDDELYEKYKIKEEHIKLLVNKYNLLNDNEVNQLQNEYDDIHKNLVNLNLQIVN